MIFLRSNTAVIVAVGPFYDKTDGVTIETALTITNERITLIAETDAGSAPTLILDNITGATAATANDLNYITNGDNGMMQIELAAADVNRVGRMKLSITDAANHVPVFHEFFVLPAAIFDWLTGVIVPLPANVTQWLGTAASTPTVAGVPNVNAKTWNDLTTVALPLIPTTAGRTLDCSVGGEAGVDWANIGSPTTANALTATTIAVTQKVDVETIKTNAVVNGGTITFPTTATLASTTNITAGTITTVGTLTTYTGNTPQTGDVFPLASTEIADIKTKTDFLPSVTAGAAGGLFIAGANAATSITTALTANVVGNVTGNLSGSVGSVTGAVGSVTGLTAATVHSDLDDIQARIPAALVGGRIDASVGAIAANAITAAATAADFSTEVRSIASGTADSGTTTTMVDAALTEADTDYWKGNLIVFTSGTLLGQSRLITAFTPATDTITFAPATTVAVGTHTYEIWPTGKIEGVTLVDTLTTYTGNTVQTGDSFARIGAAGASLTAIDLPNQTMDIVGNITGNLSGSVGSVTGAVGSVTGLTAATVHSDLDDIQARLPAALTANGNIKASLVEILTTALTETSGLLAAAFKKWFNVATPTGTVNSIPDAVPDAAGGLPVTGTRLTSIPWNASWDAEVESEALDALNTILLDSIPADGTLPTARQALYIMTQFLLERSVSGTTLTVRKADGSTALLTCTLSDATTPTSITRAT